MAEDDDDKQYEASQKKLDDARKRGELPKSTDLATAAAYGALLIVALAAGGPLLMNTGELLRDLIADADRHATLVFTGSGTPIAGGLLARIGAVLSPWVIVPAIFVILCFLAQRAIVFAPDKLVPKLERISPIATAKNKFGRQGLFEFAKSFFKLAVISAILGVFLVGRLPQIAASMALGPGQVSVLLLRLTVDFLVIVTLVVAIIGGVDLLWQRAEHMRKNRMTRKEMTDEHKDSEGDPHVKQQRRQKGYEIATNRMLNDVPGADVVVVNPTHYAVALKWSRARHSAPVCVAKGVDEVAARIREAAAGAGVPIHSDPPTARALHAVVEIGHEIRPEHYQAVAAAIRFAEAMRKRAKGRGR